MIDNIFKTNFIGKDGFRWWIGQVAPKHAQGDQIKQVNESWGARVKVRILGYHPLDEEELSNEDLPWAQCLLSTQGGTGKGGRSKSLRVSPGDIALGFFLDGDNAQIPVIIGLFANNGAKFGGTGQYKSPFEPFTGYTNEVTSGQLLIKNESGGQTGKSCQKSPVILPKDLTDKVNKKLGKATEDLGSQFSQLSNFLKSEETQAGISQALSGVEATFMSGTEELQNKIPEALNEIEEKMSSIEVTVSESVGQIISFAGSPIMTKINNETKNLGKKISSLGNGKSIADKLRIKAETATKMAGLAQNMAGPMITTAQNELGPRINQGLIKTWNDTFASTLAATQNTSIASKFATAAQRSYLQPIKKLQDTFPCVGKKLGESLAGSVNDLLSPLMDNVENFVPCVADQFTGALFNKIIGGIDKELSSALGGVDKLLGGFNLVDNLRGKGEALFGISEAIGCIVPTAVPSESNYWQIGKGATNVPDNIAETVMKIANIAAGAGNLTFGAGNVINELQEAAGGPKGILGSLISDVGAFDFMNPNVSTQGFSSVLGECYTGPPLNCKGVKINVFGADGKGVDAKPIIGALVGESVADQTGSLIGVQLINPGNGFTVPPIVEVTDTCENGYGAVAEAVIDYDPQSPTYQQVTDIVVISAGENYPVSEDEVLDEIIIDHVVVINSGENYQESDIITDNEGNVYAKILDEGGRIINVIPPNPSITNVIPVSFIPELQIETVTGRGAILKPQISPRPSYQGQIKQVIDCITPRDGIVGFINGDPYYGPFHVHPDRGVKMVGAAHTTAPHAIIYDTPAESRSSTAVRASTVTTMTTVTSPAAPYTPSASEPTSTTTTETQTTPTPPSSSPSSPPSSPPASPPSSPPASPPSSPPPSSPPSSPPSGGGGYGY